MITKVTIENFKAHRHTEVNLAAFTVLVGANGVGKTSVLEALHILGQSLRTPLAKLLQGPWKPERVLRDHDRPARLSSRYRRDDGVENTLTAEFASSAGSAWTVTMEPGGGSVTGDVSYASAHRAHPLVAEASSVVFLRLDARAIARTGYHVADRPRVEHDGANTAAVLGAWKLDDNESWRLKSVTESLRHVVPHVAGVRVRSAPARDAEMGGGNGFNLVIDFDDAKDVPATSVSEGTLVALAILTLLHTNPQPRLVLLDDLGAELHPTGQAHLVAVLKRILEQNPKLQIVATTHSPYILDALAPEDVRVFARGPDGAARVQSLAEHHDAGHLGITTGQLWTIRPEEWVLEGQS